AATAFDLLERAKPVAGIEIRFASRQLDLPIDNPGWIALLNGGVLQRERFGGALRTEVAWFAIGDVEFVTHPGETSPAYSLASRRLMRSGNGFVLGLALDAVGYILKPEYFVAGAAFPSAEYLTATSLGPQTGPLLLDALESIVPSRTRQPDPAN
ncbi:MAG TPA: alkaline ceramidase, partial [Thermoanaerobaculia bacterium]|nr:alkaline ceramidase [Thermoanaerobaculia bacterium]